MIVVDASVLVNGLPDDGHDGDLARLRLAGESLHAPHLVDLEVLSVLRRHAAIGLTPLDRVHDRGDLVLGQRRDEEVRGLARWRAFLDVALLDGLAAGLCGHRVR
ncbi:MAG: PIN domain-containing protein [Egibacteraceae bacterium]